MAAAAPLILVVDDDLAICDMLGELLRDAGYRVECYTSSAAAILRLREGGVALVLLDWLLGRASEQSGEAVLTVAAGLRSAPPIIVMTAWRPRLAAGAPSGAAALVAKPFSVDDLLCLVGRLCPQPPGAAAGT